MADIQALLNIDSNRLKQQIENLDLEPAKALLSQIDVEQNKILHSKVMPDGSLNFSQEWFDLDKIKKLVSNKIKQLEKDATKQETYRKSNESEREMFPFNVNTVWKQYFGNIPNPPATVEDVANILSKIEDNADDIYVEDMVRYIIQNAKPGGAWHNTLIGVNNGTKSE
jgi:hypothetical protein